MDTPPNYKPKNKMCDEPQWFAMRATYRSELDLKERLEDIGMQCFIPMKTEKKVVRGRITYSQVPAVHSLLFVFGKQHEIQQFKITHPRLQYITNRCSDAAIATPLVIPTRQMEAFIAVCQSKSSEVYPADCAFKPGMRVRITTGPFEGLEGTFQRINGHRDRRFVISISGVALVTTTEVSSDMIEALD